MHPIRSIYDGVWPVRVPPVSILYEASLANVHLSAGTWHFVDYVCLLRHSEGGLDLSEERTEVDSGWPFLLPFPVVLPRRPGCRGRADEGARITIPHESFHEVVLHFFQVLSLLCDARHRYTLPYPLHMCSIVRPKVEVPFCGCLIQVYSDVKFTIFFLSMRARTSIATAATAYLTAGLPCTGNEA